MAQVLDRPRNDDGDTNLNGNAPKFTKQSESILQAATLAARDQGQRSVGPLHLFFVLLCGTKTVDLNQLEDYTPTEPSYLWRAVESAQDLDRAKQLVQATRKRLLVLVPSPPEPQKNDGNVTAVHQKKFNRWTGTRKIQSPPLESRNSPSSQPAESISQTQTPGIPIDGGLVTIFQRADNLRSETLPEDKYIGPLHLSLAVIENKEISDILTQNQTTRDEVARALRDLKVAKVTIRDDNGFPYLSRFATDMIASARDNKFDETIGRDEEIRRLMQILCRRTKNSAILIGEPGVGKTAVVEGLAYRLAHGQVPKTLNGTLYNLDLGALFAGAGKGEYEESHQRVKGVVNDVKNSQQTGSPIILFIDEIHLLCVGKGQGGQSGMDAANLLKPELARGDFRCVGATTVSEYREYIEKDGALSRRFAQVMVNEPTPEQAITILRGVREKYEGHHAVWIMDTAVTAAVNLAHRYLTSRRLPDSAFDLLDEACASSRIQRDLNTEPYEKVKQAEREKRAYIDALERDDQKDNDEALKDARKALADLKQKEKQLEREQGEADKQWKAISTHRDKISKKRAELQQARSAPKLNEKMIMSLDKELQRLREQLVELEKQRVASDGQNVLLTPPGVITQENIAAVVEKATKIPVRQLLSSEKKRLLNVHNALKAKVKGQSEAVEAIANAIQISRAGLGNANRPIACFLFTGPSGTGKTLVSKSLAEELFGQSNAMVRIDGSEYSQSHSVSRLIGAPPGYVGYDQGGQLTEYVRRTPYCIVLLDEIEKACFEFWTLFLQVMDEGRLTDGQGRLVDFRNTIIIMTSNVGADILSRTKGQIPPDVKNKVIQKFTERGLPPEFLNRIDEIVMFKPMQDDVMRQIMTQQIDEIRKRDGLKNITLRISDEAQSWLIKQGISEQYGARLLMRVLQTQVLNPLAGAILRQEVQEGSIATFRVNGTSEKLELDTYNPVSHERR